MADTNTAAAERELVLTRIIDAPPEKLFRAWTEPEIMKQWFVPRPWTISKAETDLRPGGASLIVMRNPEGEEFPNRGVYLEVIPNRKLVFTDAYTSAWVPALKPFMTVIVTFEEGAPARRNIPPAFCTGVRKTRKPTRKWVFTKAGASAPISWPRS